MGTVIDLQSRRRRPKKPEKPAGHGGRFVNCTHCAEKHPLIRMVDGSEQCLTAFTDGRNWFCQNRGCRAAWLNKKDG